jgi:hypothetical protein
MSVCGFVAITSVAEAQSKLADEMVRKARELGLITWYHFRTEFFE